MTLVGQDTRTIGSALTAGRVGYGCWRLVNMSPAEARSRIVAALDAGMTLIDTADVYGLDHGGNGFGTAEALLGDVLRADPSLRDRMVLATKGGIVPPTPYDSSPAHLAGAVDASLRRLGVDVIDLYQIHRPDVFTHPAAVAEALVAMREAGKVREVGISNHTPYQHEALQSHLPFPLATIQPQLSAAHLDPIVDGTLDVAMRRGTTVLAWSPLAGGALATGEGPGVRPELIATLDRLAAREEASRSDVALAFVLAHPSAPIPIVGSITPERIAASPAALAVELDRGDLYDIVEASTGEPLP
jgi:predicted oxidoreductase